VAASLLSSDDDSFTPLSCDVEHGSMAAAARSRRAFLGLPLDNAGDPDPGGPDDARPANCTLILQPNTSSPSMRFLALQCNRQTDNHSPVSLSCLLAALQRVNSFNSGVRRFTPATESDHHELLW